MRVRTGRNKSFYMAHLPVDKRFSLKSAPCYHLLITSLVFRRGRDHAHQQEKTVDHPI